jgi:hypothetical protein
MTDYTADADTWWRANSTAVQDQLQVSLQEPLVDAFPDNDPLQPESAPDALTRIWQISPPSPEDVVMALLLNEPIHEFRIDIDISHEVFSKQDGSSPSSAVHELEARIKPLRNAVHMYLRHCLEIAPDHTKAKQEVLEEIKKQLNDRQPKGMTRLVISKGAFTDDEQKQLAVDALKVQDQVIADSVNSAVLVLGHANAPRLCRVNVTPAVVAPTGSGLRGYLRVRLAADLAGAKAFGFTWDREFPNVARTHRLK